MRKLIDNTRQDKKVSQAELKWLIVQALAGLTFGQLSITCLSLYHIAPPPTPYPSPVEQSVQRGERPGAGQRHERSKQLNSTGAGLASLVWRHSVQSNCMQ